MIVPVCGPPGADGGQRGWGNDPRRATFPEGVTATAASSELRNIGREELVRSLLDLLEQLLPDLWRVSRGRDAALAEIAHGIDDGPVADRLIVDSGCVPPEGE